ncbi:hypothetical protein HNR19_004332 [Nocardioides thalensis]|uniref:DUF4064 domain-containing protein n=1 Tax=Nocardioides thalensis TaxID=1914755 RepID=A0A853C7T6_9ACTN|nr:DUF6463 family protein [Nocardioides thalensis]NYJ03634.1 hypothetical protein [Nocardioides thalensis]
MSTLIASPTTMTRSSGFWTVLLAVVHVLATPLFYADSLQSILDAGVLGAVDSDPDLTTLRAAAFWYVTAGLLLGAVGWMVMLAERRGTGAPRGFALALGLTGAWGVILSPLSGFWLFLVIAFLARRNTVQA